ncbi:hybrid sensor histidine kinase/response regulator [Thioflexithrix psekupsensis]|uniref:Chemotaxis protein CheA n=1 Tax=Thioflexithrix psekupsensis TaxID=1570016 RepID=A0A251XAD6_9GAMM|nr:hybrid sensor histidine kinase/response regulator [Thioflexithrix psekupsensis]OUD15278.1 hypothetical protein TPSD3_01745 [Thioflexithrix psekupsensis]
MFKSEYLENLQQHLAAESHQLYDALATLADVDSDTAAQQHALHQAQHYLQQLEASADRLRLHALQKICLRMQNQLSEFPSEITPRLARCRDMERWPQHISHYLVSPEDERVRLRLLQATGLFNDHESIGLSEELAEDITHLEHPPLTEDSPPIPTDNILLLETDLDTLAEEAPNELLLAKEDSELDWEEARAVPELEMPNDAHEKLLSLAQAEEAQTENNAAEEAFSEKLFHAQVDDLLEEDMPTRPELDMPALADTEESTEKEDDTPHVNLSLDSSESNRVLDDLVFDDIDLQKYWPAEEEHSIEDLLEHDDTADLHDEGLNDLPVILPDEQLDALIDEVSFADPSQEHLMLDEQLLTPEKTDISSSENHEEDVNRRLTRNKFEQLSNHIVSISDELAQNLQQFVTQDEDSEDFLNAVEYYTNHIQGLWELAEAAQLKGVQEVCTLINDNFFELSAQSQTTRFAAHDLLAQTPHLLLDYLQTPRESAPHLIKQLQHPQWPQPLTPEKAEALQKQLIQETIVSKIEYTPSRPTSSATKVVSVVTAVTPVATRAVVVKPAPPENRTPPAEPTNEFDDLDELDDLDDLDDDYINQQIEQNYNFIRADLGDAFIDDDTALASENATVTPNLPATDVTQDDTSDELTNESADDAEIDLPLFSESLLLEQETEQNDIADFPPPESTLENDNDPFIDDSNETDPLETAEITEELTDELASPNEDEPETLEASEALEELGELDALEALEASEALSELGELDALGALEDSETLGELDELPEAIAPSNESDITTNESDWSLTDANTLDVLRQEIAEAMAELEKATHKFLSAEDDSEALLESVEQYTDNVQAISDASERAQIAGITNVCQFINDNFFELSTHGYAIRRAAGPYLSAWPSLLQHYLQQPHIAAPLLVKHLTHVAWPMPLKSEQAHALLSRLTQGQNIDLPLDETPEEQSHPFAPAEAPEPAHTAVLTLTDPDTLQLIIGQLIDSTESLEELRVNLTQPTADTDKFALAEAYTEQVQALWDVADMAKLTGVQAVCEFANNNIMGLAAEEGDIAEETQQLFAEWPGYLLAYLEQTTADSIQALVKQLQHPAWPSPLDDTAAEELQQQLTPTSDLSVTASLPESEPELIVQLADPDTLSLVIGQVVDTQEQTNELLEQLLTSEGDELLTAAATYTESVQGLWETADMAGLTGLQNICSHINDNVMLLASFDTPQRAERKGIFADWLTNVQNYLESPVSGATALLEHLQDSRWPQPLDAEDVPTWRDNLLPTPRQNVASQPQTEFILAAPETLDLVREQLNDMMPELTAALEECVAMETENPALLEAIENYTNQVQALWDAADMAGLQGLQEVCTFVNDNLMAMGAQSVEQRNTLRPYLAAWPSLVLDYLSQPLTGVQPLLAHLQAAEWPQPLDAAQTQHLHALLTQPSSSVEQRAAYETQLATESAYAPTADNESESEAEEEDDSEREPPSELAVDSSGEVSLGSAEALEILTGELQESKDELAEQMAIYLSLESNAPGFAEATENYTDIIMRLHTAAEMLGLEGLQSVCIFLSENVRQLGEKDKAARQKAKKWLELWPEQIMAYLQSPQEHVVALVNNFREPEWARPLSDDTAHHLLNQLMQGSTVEESEEEAAAYARQTEAKPEDVLLTIPGDVNRELLEAYLQEVPQHAADFSEVIQNIIADPQVPDIERAQRIAHTLKGSSNIIGIKGIANIAHHLEDTLEYLAQKRVTPPKELTDTMVAAADCLESMVDALTGQDDPPDNALQVLQSVLDWANQIDKGKLNAPPAAAASAGGSKPAAAPKAKKTEAATTEEKTQDAGGAVAAGSPEQFLRVPTRTVDDLMRLVGELSIAAGQIQERLRHVTGSTRLLIDQSMILQRKTFELENLVDVRGITGVETRYAETAEFDEDFDPLEFEEYNELHSVAHSFIESIADSRELAVSIRTDLAELESMFIQQERLNKEFQATIMTTRMVPVATIVSKLQRNVRQTCRATGKKAELDVLGTDIMIDSDVLDKLGDPLMHILRNSIDHGIEPADERAILGKDESGRIELKFYREGNNIVVSCKDDGAGLNYTNIRYTAIQRGLITETQELSEPELARLILMSGFSTKSGVTQVSGRGVGMDVVHTNIREMKGTLDIISETGHGTQMLIKLPMSLVTVHVLLVRVGQNRYGIPTNHLEQALAAGVSEFHRVGDEVTLKMGKHMYSLKSLADLLGVAGDKPSIEGYEHRPIVLVHEETGVTAVIVDELLDTHDLVMKNMGKYVKNIHGVAGASILGDGSLVPLLDLPQLLRSPMQAAMNSYMAEQGLDPHNLAATPQGIPKVLIVDDSLSVRKSLSILVEDAGFEVLLAKDGVEAIEVMSQNKPNVMLVDMEMPRMNGLELTSHVRANPTTKTMPIFMITSRTTEKHREQARSAGVSAYLTKPYQDTELLDLIDKGLAGKM